MDFGKLNFFEFRLLGYPVSYTSVYTGTQHCGRCLKRFKESDMIIANCDHAHHTNCNQDCAFCDGQIQIDKSEYPIRSTTGGSICKYDMELADKLSVRKERQKKRKDI